MSCFKGQAAGDVNDELEQQSAHWAILTRIQPVLLINYRQKKPPSKRRRLILEGSKHRAFSSLFPSLVHHVPDWYVPVNNHLSQFPDSSFACLIGLVTPVTWSLGILCVFWKCLSVNRFLKACKKMTTSSLRRKMVNGGDVASENNGSLATRRYFYTIWIINLLPASRQHTLWSGPYLDSVLGVLLSVDDFSLELFSLELFSFFGLLFLKSVAYQPVPFNLKPAAEIFLLKVGLSQLGQSFKGASDIFCSFSNWWSQSWHWYS